jgi:hypothetical protein
MSILNIIVILLVLSWIGGLSFRVGGGLIHLLLVIAAIIFFGRLLGLF